MIMSWPKSRTAETNARKVASRISNTCLKVVWVNLRVAGNEGDVLLHPVHDEEECSDAKGQYTDRVERDICNELFGLRMDQSTSFGCVR